MAGIVDEDIPDTLVPRIPQLCRAVAESLVCGDVPEFGRVGIHDHPDHYLEAYKARPGVVRVRLCSRNTEDVAAWLDFSV